MSLPAAYIALVVGVIVWFLIARKFTAKPWESPPAAAEAAAGGSAERSPARVGLWVFLAVVTSLFALFASAYYMRMGHGHGQVHDWNALAEPPILWLNTALLFVGSLAMQWSRAAVKLGHAERTRDGLIAGGLLTVTFLAGQFYAWGELRASEFFTPANPAVAFFYVLTAVHGLHLLGGLFVWGRTLVRMHRKGAELIDVRLSIELCTVYWHYLLLVWLVLFTLLLAT